MLSTTRVREIKRTLPAEPSGLLAPRMFAALGDQTRWRLFALLIEHRDLCVTDLANVLDISVPAASQHLRILELSGLVHKERTGQTMCYQIAQSSPATRLMVRLVKTFIH